MPTSRAVRCRCACASAASRSGDSGGHRHDCDRRVRRALARASRDAGWSPVAPASSARIWSKPCSASTRRSSGWTTSRPATGATSTRCGQRWSPSAGGGIVSSKATSATCDACRARLRRRRFRAAPGRARLGAALARGPDRAPTPPTSTGSSTCWSPRATRACARFVYAASSSTYGDHPALPKVEDTIGQPLSPYAVTKLVNELYADVFGRCYGLQSIGLRYFNVFGAPAGPGRRLRRRHPALGRAMLLGEPVDINGDGETSRDFCYVDNVVQANLLAATTDDAEAVNQVYNVARRTTHVAESTVRSCCATRLRPVFRGVAERPTRPSRLPAGRRAPFAGRHRQGARAARLCADAPPGRWNSRRDALVSGAFRFRTATEANGDRRAMMNSAHPDPAALRAPLPIVAALTALWLFACPVYAQPATGEPESVKVSALLSDARRYEHGEGVVRDPLRAVRALLRGGPAGRRERPIQSGLDVRQRSGCAAGRLAGVAVFRDGRGTGSRVSRGRCSRLVGTPRPTSCPNACASPSPPVDEEPPLRLSAKSEFVPTTPEQKKAPNSSISSHPNTGSARAWRWPSSARNRTSIHRGFAQERARLDAAHPRDFGAIQRQEALRPGAERPGGLAYLRWLLAYFRGDVALVAAAYNAGEGP